VSREDLTERFNSTAEFLSSDDLKIFHNNVKDTASSEARWLERIATFINKSRVPKDWSDNDVADFKVKVKVLSQKFLMIEATISDTPYVLDGLMLHAFDSVLNLMPTMREKMYIARRLINE